VDILLVMASEPESEPPSESESESSLDCPHCGKKAPFLLVSPLHALRCLVQSFFLQNWTPGQLVFSRQDGQLTLNESSLADWVTRLRSSVAGA